MTAVASASRIKADVARCTGCRLCEMNCALAHEQVYNPKKAAIRVLFPTPDLPQIVVCRNCETPRCVEACDAGAIVKDVQTAKWVIDQDLCTACGACVDMCPFDAVFVHPDKQTPILCDLCGGNPVCVEKCPMGALSVASVNSSS